MKEKRRKFAVLILTAIVFLIIIVFISVFFINRHHNSQKIDEFLNQNLELYDKFHIVCDAVTVDESKHSLAAVKEAVRLGADTVTLDLCFNADDVPIICESYDEISQDSLLLEDILELLNEEKYKNIRLFLKIKQLSNLYVFNNLLLDSGMFDRVFLVGIDSNHYSLVSGNNTSAGVFFDYIPTGNDENASKEIIELKAQYNITGVIIDQKYITHSLIDAFAQNSISYIVSNVNKELDMYEMLSMGIGIIETDNPALLKDVYTKWRDVTQERMDASIMDQLNKAF